MDKVLRWPVLALVFTLFFSAPVFAQTIAINNPFAGEYGRGSSISVHITLSGTCITDETNVFRLFLSDENGDFANEVQIGTFTGFYTTFVNGRIPDDADEGGNYRLRVKADDAPTPSAPTAPFTIRAVNGVEVRLSGPRLNQNEPEVFGACNASTANPFTITDITNGDATVTALIRNELTNTPPGSERTFDASRSMVVNAATAHYTITGIARSTNGVISSRNYLLVNNRSQREGFQLVDPEPVCLPPGDDPVAVFLLKALNDNSASSLRFAYPGTVYTITWGDNTSNVYTLCEILRKIDSEGGITHAYNASSCGIHIYDADKKIKFYNTYPIDISSKNKYCPPSTSPASGGVKVLSSANTDFQVQGKTPTSPMQACVGTVTFDNLSEPGDNPDGTVANCKNANATYLWSVRGPGETVFTPVEDSPFGEPQDINFPAPGMYTVRLTLQGGTSCNNDETDITNTRDKEICIQSVPVPAFTVNGNSGAFSTCLNNQGFRPVFTGNLGSQNCSSTTVRWTVRGNSDYDVIAGSTGSVTNPPTFRFNSAGNFIIRLTLTAGTCDEVISEIPITTNELPQAAFANNNITLCSDKFIQYSDVATSDYFVNLEGTGNPVPTTYLWSVSTISGTGTATVSDPAAKYPRIDFTGTGRFRVTVTHRNGCNDNPGAIATQEVVVEDAPSIALSTPPQVNCPGQPVPVTATLTGPSFPGEWISDGGGSFDTPTALSTNYRPTAAEVDAGVAIVRFRVTTTLPAPCNIITSAPLNITLNKNNPITSDPTKRVCSEVQFNYVITAALPNSTFRWEIDPANTSPLASGYPVSGTGNTINASIINNNPAGAAITVTYILTPTNAGCEGNSIPLVITVIPSAPLIDFSIGDNEVCGNQAVTFTNLSPPENGEYEWNFDDGTTYTGYNPPPHVFPNSPIGLEITYKVTLRLINTPCSSLTPAIKDVYVSPAAPIPSFVATPSGTCGDVTINMVNNSPGNNAVYIFELLDETRNVIGTSGPLSDKSAPPPFIAQPNPNRSINVYVRLTVTDKCGTTIRSFEQPFSISPSGLVKSMFLNKPRACTNEDVIFTNNNSTGDSFEYIIYRNGIVYDRRTNIPNGEAPPYKFTEAGTYEVALQASTVNCGPEPESARSTIEIISYPDVTFTQAIVDCNNLRFQFTATGNIDPANDVYTYLWDFGDGATSTSRDPIHTYARNGVYQVKLTTRNILDCEDAQTLPVAVTVPLKANFIVLPTETIFIPNYHFSFRDASEGGPVRWLWEFDDKDGKTSTLQNPEFTYTDVDTGYHNVKLTVWDASANDACFKTFTKIVRITGFPGQLFLPNAFIPTSSNTAINNFKAKGKGLGSWKMQIYNKWGQLVWQTDKLTAEGEPAEGWDGNYQGTAAPQGTYLWQIEATFKNGLRWKGMSYNNSPPKRTGVINLIR